MNEPTNEAPPGREEAGPKEKPPLLTRVPVIVIGTVLAGLALFFGIGYIVESFTHESTDDAFLDADYASIASRVAGQVLRAHARSNQKVNAGDLLVEIDPRDLQAVLDLKQAALKSAQANIDLIKASVELFRAQIESAQATAKQSAAETNAATATAERAAADLKRAQELIQNKTISPQEFDAARSVAAAAAASLRAAQEKAASEGSKVAEAQAQFEAGRRGYERAVEQAGQAKAELRSAELNLSYTRITAPISGHVTKKAVQEGDYVQVGQKLMALVPGELYVTANFKETQLKNIRTNMPVRVRIDSVDHAPFPAHVQSIMAGSGARFSLLPPENAVGNYIKVVQRIPVKIVFDGPVEAGHVLGPGMSAVPLVRTGTFEISEGLLLLLSVIGALIIGGVWWWLARGRGEDQPTA